MESLELNKIIDCIYIIRGNKIILDKDIARLYNIETKALKQAVKRNIERFPDDFMFELTKEEFDDLRSQIVTSSHGGDRYLPFAFTEQGVAMLSSVIKSYQAIKVNILIMRTFVQIRSYFEGLNELNIKIDKLETKSNEKFDLIFSLLDKNSSESKIRKPIGFKIKNND